MALSLNRITGEIQGHRIALWTSLISGLEIISLDDREVSRRRTFRLSTKHDLSIPELGITGAVVKLLPSLSLQLQRDGEVAATFHNRWAVPLQTLLGVVLGGLLVGVLLVAGR